MTAFDTCCAPLALRTAQPAIEPLVFALRGGDREPSVNLGKVLEIDDYFESILPKYQRHLESARVSVIDTRVLEHQIPGGMMSNLTSQLREADSLDRLDDVLEEIPRTRRDLGYPPLVTPLSQMTGAQAVNNVLFGRYAMVTGAVKDYVAGKFGVPPGEIARELREKALQGIEQEDLDASVLPPEMEAARDAVKHLTTDMDDVLTYALYPATGMKFLRIKHGLDPMPENMRRVEPATGGQQSAVSEEDGSHGSPQRARSRQARIFNVYVGGERFEVEVEPKAPERSIRVAPQPPPTAAAASTAPQPAQEAQAARPREEAPVAAPSENEVSGYGANPRRRAALCCESRPERQ